ncbi:MAG: outer membrane protein assembly factor BamD, partial [Sphingobacteriales bacterium]
MTKYVSRLLFLAIFFVFCSCSDFQRVMKSDNVDEKYAAALAYYEKEDYYRAGMLLEELMPILRGRAEAEKALFLFANAHFQQKQYLLAAYYFRNLTDTYPRGQYAEESRFMIAKSLYFDSPVYYLDQTSTVSAMDAFQSFITEYPNSQFSPRADSMYNDLSVKLEKKAYENAKLYNTVRQYKSAVVALGNFVRDYPSSNYNEEVSFL